MRLNPGCLRMQVSDFSPSQQEVKYCTFEWDESVHLSDSKSSRVLATEIRGDRWEKPNHPAFLDILKADTVGATDKWSDAFLVSPFLCATSRVVAGDQIARDHCNRCRWVTCFLRATWIVSLAFQFISSQLAGAHSNYKVASWDYWVTGTHKYLTSILIKLSRIELMCVFSWSREYKFKEQEVMAMKSSFNSTRIIFVWPIDHFLWEGTFLRLFFS